MMKETLSVWLKTQTGHDPQRVGMDDRQVNTHFSYRTGINVPSGCRVPLEMNHVGTWRSDVPTQQGKRDRGGGDTPHHPAIQLQLSPTGPGLGGVIGSLLGEPRVTRINLTVLRDQQTKDEKLEPQGSLPSRGTACHGCACGWKARTDHLPGHGPSSPSLGRWVTVPLNSAAENFLLPHTLGPACFSKGMAGYAFIWARC